MTHMLQLQAKERTD